MSIYAVREMVCNREIQCIFNGSLLFFKGCIDGWKVLESNDSSTSKKVTGVAASVMESFFGVYLFYLGTGYQSYEDARNHLINLSQEYADAGLSLSETDEDGRPMIIPSLTSKFPKQNCLVLQAYPDSDPDGYLRGDSGYNTNMRIAKQCRSFNFEYVNSPEMICSKIKSISSSNGPIDKLFIEAHGEPFAMLLSEYSDRGENYISAFNTEFPQDCFAGLSEKGYVYLLSCRVGELLNKFMKDRGMAAHMARQTGRTVVASDVYVRWPNIHVIDLNDPDLAGGIRFSDDDYLDHPGQYSYTHTPDHTVICSSPEGHCEKYTSLPRGIIIELSYSLIRNSFLIRNYVVCDLFGLRFLSMSSSLLASVLDGGVDITSPLAKKISYALLDPSQRPEIDTVGNVIYKISKVSVTALADFGKIASLFDSLTYFGLKGVAKTATYSGEYLEKGVDYLSDVTPQSNYTLVNLAGKTAKLASKTAFRLLNWSGRALDYILG